jgi:photosystem I subunit 3
VKHLFALVLALVVWFSIVPSASAQNTILIPCKDSTAFLERMKSAPNDNYFTEPNKAEMLKAVI